MKNGDMPAMPLGEACLSMANVNTAASGLTKREHFAGLALQAILSRDIGCQFNNKNLDKVARLSVRAADLLLEELEKCAAPAATES